MKKLINVFFATVTFGSLSYGQIGINTETPDSSSAMDIQSPSGSNRGVLLPRMTTSEMNAISSPAQGLMIFNITDKLFYYFDGSQWVGLVPKQMNTGYSNDPMLNGNLVVDSGSVVSPNMSTQNLYSSKATIDTLVSLNVPGYSVNALVPTGAIIMWSGSTPPTGWALCDGQSYLPNGAPISTWPPFVPLPANLFLTPDLRGRFIVGAGQNSNSAVGDINPSYLIDETGGKNQTVLTKDQLPKHQHVITNGVDGATQSNPGDHNHAIGYESQTRSGGGAGTDVVRDAPGNTGNKATSTNGAHTHSGNTGDGTSDGLNATPVDNRPPYYVLAYIIKLP